METVTPDRQWFDNRDKVRAGLIEVCGMQLSLLRTSVGADAVMLHLKSWGETVLEVDPDLTLDSDDPMITSFLNLLAIDCAQYQGWCDETEISVKATRRGKRLGLPVLLAASVDSVIPAVDSGECVLHGTLMFARRNQEAWTAADREKAELARRLLQAQFDDCSMRLAQAQKGRWLQEYFTQSPDLIGRFNQDGRLIYVNDILRRQFGFDEDPDKTPLIDEILTPCAQAQLRAWIDSSTLEPLRFAEHRPDLAGGRIEWLEWTIHRDRTRRSGVSHYFATGKDISDRRGLEKMARECDRQLKRLFNETPAMFFILDRLGRISAVNDHWAAQIGYAKDVLVGAQISSFLTEQSAALMRRVIYPKMLTDGRIEDQQIDLVKADGSTLETVFSAVVERDDLGKPAKIHCVANDVSRQVRALDAIEQQRRRFEAIVHDQSELISRFRPDGTITFVNDAYCRFFGLEDAELLGRSVFELWPDAAARAMRNRIEEIVGADPVEGQFEFVDARGTRWLSTTIRPIMNRHGKVTEFQSVATDVTQSRATALLLKQNEERLRQIIDHMFVFVAILTPKGQLIEINKAPLDHAGIDRLDVLGKSFWEGPWWSHSGDTVDQLREAVRLASKGENIRYDVTAGGGSRKPITMDFQIAPMMDDQGEVVHLVVSGVDVTARKEAEQKFEHAAMHDSLTGLANRALFRISIERENEWLAREGGCLALMSIDLDRFKQVNDRFGHSVGDGLLKQVADRLRSCTRRTDIIARLGGDEFAVVVISKEIGDHLEILAQRIVEAIKRPFEVDGNRISIGASLGLAVITEACADVEELTVRSDMALYSAKETGRGTWQYYQPAMKDRVRSRRRAERELETAIADDQLVLHYQPIMASGGGGPLGIEGLVRWNHPKRGLIGPEEFLGLAEERGFLANIRGWVLRKALLQHKTWLDGGLTSVPVSINIGHIAQDSGGVFQEVVGIIEEIGARPSDLVLDFAEKEVAHGSAILGLIQQLEDYGVRVAIDDFGTGATSITRLGLLPATQLKIDSSILTSEKAGFDGVSMVGAIVNIARANGMLTVMEGVETKDQLVIARDAGCSAVQGFLLQKPIAGKEFGAWLAGNVPASLMSSTRH